MKSFIASCLQRCVYHKLSWFLGYVLRGGKLDSQRASHWLILFSSKFASYGHGILKCRAVDTFERFPEKKNGFWTGCMNLYHFPSLMLLFSMLEAESSVLPCVRMPMFLVTWRGKKLPNAKSQLMVCWSIVWQSIMCALLMLPVSLSCRLLFSKSFISSLCLRLNLLPRTQKQDWSMFHLALSVQIAFLV